MIKEYHIELLDPNFIYGWEIKKGRRDIEGIKRSIKAGKGLSAIPVSKVSENEYQLIPFLAGIDKQYWKEASIGGHVGGHKRARAYLELGRPAKCDVVMEGDIIGAYKDILGIKKPIPIKDIILI